MHARPSIRPLLQQRIERGPGRTPALDACWAEMKDFIADRVGDKRFVDLWGRADCLTRLYEQCLDEQETALNRARLD